MGRSAAGSESPTGVHVLNPDGLAGEAARANQGLGRVRLKMLIASIRQPRSRWLACPEPPTFPLLLLWQVLSGTRDWSRRLRFYFRLCGSPSTSGFQARSQANLGLQQ